MSAFPGSPRLVRAGIVTVDPDSGQVLRVIPVQYNPDSLTRTLQAQAVGDGKDRSVALRLKGPPVETIKVDLELDATDGLADGDPTTIELGVGAQLSVLETLLYPPSARLIANDALQAMGTLEISPLLEPLTLFVWGSQRVVPVRITDFSITEEAFDARLDPIRAKVSLSMRVLSVDDLGFGNKGGSLWLIHHQTKERLARRAVGGSLPTLGLTGIP